MNGKVIVYWYTKISALIGVNKVFSILLPKHKPRSNISIMTSPDSILYDFASVNIEIFTCS